MDGGEFGRGLKRTLKKKHITEKTLAERAGIRYGRLSRYVRGEAVPGVDTALKLAAAIGQTVEEIAERGKNDE